MNLTCNFLRVSDASSGSWPQLGGDCISEIIGLRKLMVGWSVEHSQPISLT